MRITRALYASRANTYCANGTFSTVINAILDGPRAARLHAVRDRLSEVPSLHVLHLVTHRRQPSHRHAVINEGRDNYTANRARFIELLITPRGRARRVTHARHALVASACVYRVCRRSHFLPRVKIAGSLNFIPTVSLT